MDTHVLYQFDSIPYTSMIFQFILCFPQKVSELELSPIIAIWFA